MNAEGLRARLVATEVGSVPDAEALLERAFPADAPVRGLAGRPLLRLLAGATLATAAGAPLWIAPSRAEQERAAALATRTLVVANRFAELNRTGEQGGR